MKFARETDLLRDAIANWFAPGFFNTIRDEREFQVGSGTTELGRRTNPLRGRGAGVLMNE
jgi:hypothetical protein